MALIADCNVATAITDGWIDPTSLNQPTEIGSDGIEHTVYQSAVFTALLAGTVTLVQTVQGLNNSNGSQTVAGRYTRVSSIELGHVLGTDFTEWTKIA